mgnify:CR=1 FL=1
MWDAAIISSYDSDVSSLVTDIQTLMDSQPYMVQQYSSITAPSLWANESYGYVLTNVYDYDSPGMCVSFAIFFPLLCFFLKVADVLS